MPAIQNESMGRSPRPFIVAAALFMFLCLGLMFTAIYFATKPHGSSLHELEVKTGGDLRQYLLNAHREPLNRTWFRRNPSLRGELFWAHALRDGIVDADAHRKLCALTGSDTPLTSEESIRELPAPSPWCSYTAPQVSDLDKLLNPDAERCVIACFNARNWNNRLELGVLVIWNDSQLPQWLSFDQANADWGITAEEWADPAGKLFGKKAPFQHTYE